MATTADDRLAAQVARELSSPEPAVHFGLTLLIATLVASPVLGAAAMGHQSVPVALALYLAAILVAWLVVGLMGGAFAMAGRTQLLAGREADATSEPARSGTSTPSPSATTESVGSNGAH